jgi:hypothetical protein
VLIYTNLQINACQNYLDGPFIDVIGR